MRAEGLIRDAVAEGRTPLFHSSPNSINLTEDIITWGLEGDIGPWRREILEHSGLDDEDIQESLVDRDNRAVFLSMEPSWMAAIAARGQGKAASSKLPIDELAEHAVLTVCLLDPEEQPLFTAQLDDMGCQTGKSVEVTIKDGEITPGEVHYFLPVGAETNDLFVPNDINADDIIVLDGEAAVQFAARNHPQVLLQQVSDPQNLKSYAAQFDDNTRQALLQGKTQEKAFQPGRNR
jgi:hypothetical protein